MHTQIWERGITFRPYISFILLSWSETTDGKPSLIFGWDSSLKNGITASQTWKSLPEILPLNVIFYFVSLRYLTFVLLVCYPLNSLLRSNFSLACRSILFKKSEGHESHIYTSDQSGPSTTISCPIWPGLEGVRSALYFLVGPSNIIYWEYPGTSWRSILLPNPINSSWYPTTCQR